ncbi:MAG: DEAD/DEAH box helicase [Deltaproteobacteria bacterium]|nr:DEAD/DEAH box helicase [Deltaproteobacteria bacterium]
MNFKSFNLHQSIESGIEALGYREPTPIQMQCIPHILRERDVMGLAQTGTGKTAAFVLPIMQRLINAPRKSIRVLIIAPTRELAEQTHNAIGQFGQQTKLTSITVYGGIKKELQIRKLREGAEIVVACPGRLLDLMDQKVMDLSSLEVLVLDEADRMFDMGFLPDIRRIMKRLPVKRQTLLFSATMPDDIRELAEEVLCDPVTIQIGNTAPVSTVSHALYPVESHLKRNLLMRLMESVNAASVLVFTRTKARATRLAKDMKKSGFFAASLQGDMPQNKRQAALKGFRDGQYKILVATDIAARGIDVSGISHVINYDMPDTVDAYTHRIGRTGRAARTGEAFTFVTSQDRAFVWTIENVLGEKIERRTVEDFDYTVPAPAGSGGFVSPQRPVRRQRVVKSIDQFPAHQAVAASSAGNSQPGSHQLSRRTSLFTSSRTKSRRPRSVR